MGSQDPSTSITWRDLHHTELDTHTLYALLALRSEVFVVEQNCPYQDLDFQDLALQNRHILGYRSTPTPDSQEPEQELIAIARILTPASPTSPVKIGRVVVSPRARGLGLGYALMEAAIASAERHWPGRTIKLSAQAHLQKFYGASGFVKEGEGPEFSYLEDGIPHVAMVRVGKGVAEGEVKVLVE
jgi:ElaA protein